LAWTALPGRAPTWPGQRPLRSLNFATA
jgi:hypothetical protein